MMSPAGGAVRQPRADAQGHCANRVDVAKLCPLVANQTTHRDDVLGTRYAYQQEIYQASCIVPADSPDARREKIREFWRRSGASLTCTQLDFTVKDGPRLKLAVQKNAQDFVEEAVLAGGNDEFDNTPFVGTLENDGVGIAPFHDFESKVPAELQGELDALKEAIIAGDVEVTSYLAE